MFVVIFEVQPRQERFDDYLALAGALKPKLEGIDGFIDVERFKSTRDETRVLSLSTWRDEKAVIRWRTHGVHHDAQEKGRSEIFQDYQLRVGEVTSDTAADVPIRQERFDATEVGKAKFATITEIMPARHSDAGGNPEFFITHIGLDPEANGLVSHEMFESIYNPGKRVLLASWRDADSAESWSPLRLGAATPLRHRGVRIIRDYGMHERREAPQYYPHVSEAEAPYEKSQAAGWDRPGKQ